MDIRWGIIGCGAVTEVKSGPAFQRARGSRLQAVMRRNGSLAADYARRHGVPSWYDDAEKLIRDPEVDAVYVATPPGWHLEYALAACAAGKPTYVEKPMARNHPECLRMVDAFAAARVPLFVAYYRRALDRFRKAAELVQSGALGRVTGVAYRFAAPHHRAVDPAALPWRLSAAEAGGGLFLDLGCHTLDVLDFLLGPLVEVSGMAANVASRHAVEDTVAMAFATAGGALGTAHWNFAGEERADEIVVQGDAGQLRLSTFGNEPIELNSAGRLETFDLPNPPHIQQPMVQSIVDQLLGRGESPSTGVTAARTSAVMDAVLASYYGGRADAFWTRPETWPGAPRRR
jgi:predicted dehydrogenase